MPTGNFPTLQLLIALVESGVPCPIYIRHATWLSESGDVEGHFYMKSHRTDIASSTLHFSVAWPPSTTIPTERGEDPLTKRRRRRRNVFESFTASSKTSPQRGGAGANSILGASGAGPNATMSSMRSKEESTALSSFDIDEGPCDVVAMLLYPQAETDGAATTATKIDYLTVQRFQQFCDLPPDPHGASQEALLIRFPSSTIPASYHFTTAFVSSDCKDGRVIAMEMAESDAPLLKQSTITSKGDDVTSTATDSSFGVNTRCQASKVIQTPKGSEKRLVEVSTTCVRAFPPDWRGRLRVFLLVEYKTSVRHVTRYSLLGAIAAPQPPPPPPALLSASPPPAIAPKATSQTTSDEAISWTHDANKESTMAGSSPTRHGRSNGRNTSVRVLSPPSPIRKQQSTIDFEMRFPQLFPGVEPGHIQQRQQQQPSSKHNTDLRKLTARDLLLLAAGGSTTSKQPGATSPKQQQQQQQPKWQTYDGRRYDEPLTISQRHQRDDDDPSSGALLLNVVDVDLWDEEREIEQAQYIAGLQNGCLSGYLVDGPIPIERDVHIRPTHRPAGNEINKQIEAAYDAMSVVSAGAQHYGSNSSGARSPTSSLQPPPAAAVHHRIGRGAFDVCLSTQTLRVLQTDAEMFRAVPAKSADPFVRIRRGLLPAIERDRHRAKEATKKAHIPKGETSVMPNMPVSSVAGVVGGGGGVLESPLGGAGEEKRTLSPQQRVDRFFPRRTFLDRFVEAVTKIEDTRYASTSNSTAASSPHSNHEHDNHIRRPAPIVLGLQQPLGASTYLGRSMTPSSAQHRIGLSSLSSGGGPRTPRSAVRMLLQWDLVSQAMEDWFYSMYGQHGAGEHQPQQQAGGTTTTTTMVVASGVSLSTAVELCFWLHKILHYVVTVEASVLDPAESTMPIEASSALQPNDSWEAIGSTSSAALPPTTLDETSSVVILPTTTTTVILPTAMMLRVLVHAKHDYASNARTRSLYETRWSEVDDYITNGSVNVPNSLVGQRRLALAALESSVREKLDHSLIAQRSDNTTTATGGGGVAQHQNQRATTNTNKKAQLKSAADPNRTDVTELLSASLSSIAYAAYVTDVTTKLSGSL